MTSPSLILGSILLAFSPSFSLLLLIVSNKPQLVILAVCSAFAYLLSALASSFVWFITSAILLFGREGDGGDSVSVSINTLLLLAPTGVVCQMCARCAYVCGYFKIETVIRQSVLRHETETTAAAAAATSEGVITGNNGRDSATTIASNNGSTAANANATHEEGRHAPVVATETEALQLQLNDLSCSLASGCGYATLHSLFLYGTLLASESGEANSYDDGAYVGGGGSTGYGGTLYQSSCTGMPSLIHGALIAGMFSCLDVMWMMICFYGMRRRYSKQYARLSSSSSMSERLTTTFGALVQACTCRGLDDSVSGGNAAILFVAMTHLLASLVLAPNAHEDGCKISLPCLGGVVLWVGMALGCVLRGGHFLPIDQRRRIQGIRFHESGVNEPPPPSRTFI